MKVLIVPNTTKKASFNIADEASAILHDESVVCLMDETFKDTMPFDSVIEFMAINKAFELCDVVITIGGDGTFLHAARTALIYQKPLLGINIGHLGFLTSIESDELLQLKKLATKNYYVHQRSVIQAFTTNTKIECGTALNDIVISKYAPNKILELDIYCNHVKVSGFRGDGVIFSTPTGSTAYNLSAGGPIVDADLNSIIVTSICPHIVHAPPMVFSDKRQIKAVPSKENECNEIFISCDGLAPIDIPTDESITITAFDKMISLISFNKTEQLHAIDKKIKAR